MTDEIAMPSDSAALPETRHIHQLTAVTGEWMNHKHRSTRRRSIRP
jgi:hypothetical protein